MPRFETPAKHPCFDCGLPMLWTARAVRSLGPRTGTAQGMAATVQYADAYQCPSGHLNPRCVLCSSYDTDVSGQTVDPPRLDARCSFCRGPFIVVTP